MAGIGFEIRRLSRQETILSVLASAGHASVIAAGPWIFTILSLAAITLLSEHIAGFEAVATFRVIVIYSFALSLVLTAPIIIVVTRRVADALWQKAPERVPSLLAGASLAASGSIAIGLALFLLVVELPASLALALTGATMVVGLIWVALCFCGTVRDYRAVTLSFLLGLLCGVGASVTASVLGAGAAGITLGFISGLTVTLAGLIVRILATFPHPVRDPLEGLAALLAGLRELWPLALGALAGTVGVWIDKWVYWASAVGERIAGGLLHAPLYDSAMFIASLTMIPSLAAFVTRLETEFFERYQRYYATIRSHGTFQQIEAARARLAAYTLDTLTRITLVQIGLGAMLVLAAPQIIEVLSLRFQQASILRYGAIGAVFQFIFIAASSILLFFDRRFVYLSLQMLFLVLMLGFSLASVQLGDDYAGVGYFLACLFASLAALIAADRTFDTLNFLTFIGNNPSVSAASASRRPLRPSRPTPAARP
jgi:uncharacterized membrane protein